MELRTGNAYVHWKGYKASSVLTTFERAGEGSVDATVKV